MAIDGDYAVATSLDDNSAYVFRRTGDEAWDTGIRVAAPTGSGGFGRSVAIDGEYMVIGADLTNTFTGQAFVYRRSGDNAWNDRTELVATGGGDTFEYFGGSVDVDGDYIIVGERLHGSSGNQTGAAYVFRRIGDNAWDGGTRITAADGQDLDFFGGSVAIHGDYAVVGATGPVSSPLRPGVVYVFRRTDANAWAQEVRLTRPGGGTDGDDFGSSVAIHGDYIAVGADSVPVDNSAAAGSVYIFRRSGDAEWQVVAQSDGTEPGARRGMSAAISESVAAFGAPSDVEGDINPGAAYIWSYR